MLVLIAGMFVVVNAVPTLGDDRASTFTTGVPLGNYRGRE
jgi:hypothetical protein